MEWWAWKRRKPDPPWGDGTIDWQMNTPMGRLHLMPETVGGWTGRAGRTLCGVAVPAGNADEVLEWSQHGEKCRRCERRCDANRVVG